MRQDQDIFAGILRELGVPPAPTTRRMPAFSQRERTSTLVGADDASLVDAATEVTKSPVVAPSNDYLSHLLVAHATQLADEKTRRELAEKEASHTKSLIGWGVAGILGAILFVVMAKRKR